MRLRFYFDPATGLPHIYGHGVSGREVREALAGAGEDRAGTEGSRVAIGQTRAGRHVKIIYKADPEVEGLFIITAFELTGKPLASYRRRMGKRRP